jgi:hypothetical protein
MYVDVVSASSAPLPSADRQTRPGPEPVTIFWPSGVHTGKSSLCGLAVTLSKVRR